MCRGLHLSITCILVAMLAWSPAGVAAGDPDRERALQQSGLVDITADLKDKVRVAVLPFATPAGAEALRQYGEGTMDSLISGLRQIPRFIMVDRANIERVIKEQALGQTGLVDPRTSVRVGKLLQAHTLITGEIREQAGAITIAASFLDVASGQVRNTRQVSGPLDGIFELQDQLADLFIRDQQVAPTQEQQARVEQTIKATVNRDAYDRYLKGRKAYLAFNKAGYTEAIRWYEQAIAIDPKYALAQAALADAWLSLGYQRMQTGAAHRQDYERAEAASRRALELDPDLAEALRVAGRVARFLGKPGGEEQVRKALAVNPNDAESWYALWRARDEYSADPDHEYLRRALQLDPGLSAAHSDRGKALYDRKHFEAALAEYKEALRINPGLAFAQYNLGLVLQNQGRHAEAMDAFKEAARIDPGFADAYSRMGNELISLKRPQDAIVAYRKALELNPGDVTVYYNLGTALYVLNRYADAAEAYQVYVKHQPESAQAHKHLALALAYLGKRKEAAQEFELYLRYNPGAEDAAKVRELIKSLQ